MNQSDKFVPRSVVRDIYIVIALYVGLTVLMFTGWLSAQWLNRVSIACMCVGAFMIPVISRNLRSFLSLVSSPSSVSRRVLPWLWCAIGSLMVFALLVGSLSPDSTLMLVVCFVGLAFNLLLGILIPAGYFNYRNDAI